MAYREHVGMESAEVLAPRLLRVALTATPVERSLVPEVWAAEDPDERLSLTLRVLRYRWHAVVLGVSIVPIDAPRIRDAAPTVEVVREHAQRRRCSEAIARAELHVAAHDARPVDVAVQPEQWRMRSRLTMDDWSLVVRRSGGVPMIIAARHRADSRRA